MCPASVPTIIEAHRDDSFRQVMLTADFVTTDGMPLVWTHRLLGISSAQRVYGPRLTELTLEAAAAGGVPVGFYGGSPATLEALVGACAERWPALQVAYACSPPFRALTHVEEQETVASIQQSGARVLFVGLGCPKQELWANRHAATLRMPVLAVGAAFDFIARTKPQAPRWMQSCGLEWLFRLLTEPRRLWKRYVIGNPMFVLLLAAQLTGIRRFGGPAGSRHGTQGNE